MYFQIYRRNHLIRRGLQEINHFLQIPIAILKKLLAADVSHHGKMEYGAVKSPATREAYVLHILDELDSKLWVYEDVMKNTEPGTFSQPNRWLDGAVVYNSDVDLNSH